MYYAFIDESGDHVIDLDKMDDESKVFTLACVLISEENYKEIDLDFRKIKENHFGGDDFVTHMAEMTRPKKAKDTRNLKLNDKGFRHSFYKDVSKLIYDSKIKIVTCTIRKDILAKTYPSPSHPYHFSFENLLNRIMGHIPDGSLVKIIPEHRGEPHDTHLNSLFIHYLNTGIHFYEEDELKSKIFEKKLFFCKKEENQTGSQLVDLIVTTVARHIKKKTPKPRWNEVPMEIVGSKMSFRDFTVFPPSK